MRKQVMAVLAGVWLLPVVLGCASSNRGDGGTVSPLASPGQEEPVGTGVPATVRPDPTLALPTQPSPADTSPLPTPVPQQSKVEALVRRAVEALAMRNQIAVDRVEVVSVTSDEFPADNLGCPSVKKPALPIPALVTGFEIVLRAGDQTYAYRARGTEVVFCGER